MQRLFLSNLDAGGCVPPRQGEARGSKLCVRDLLSCSARIDFEQKMSSIRLQISNKSNLSLDKRGGVYGEYCSDTILQIS